VTLPPPRNADVVVLGLGASGAVLAARLSELDGLRVVGIEAGPDYPPDVELPIDLRDGSRNSMSRHDWGYTHHPMPHTPRFPLPRGRVVGGSSAVNTCIALRGQPWDYEEWRARGLAEWSWEQCLPAFQRLEHDLDFDTPWHGTDGPLPIRRHTDSELEPWQRLFVDAALELGHPACADTNDPASTGVGPHAMNKIDGRRVSAAEAWLTRTVRARKNLTLLPSTRAVRVSIERGRVTGVWVAPTDGAPYFIEARHVVLCGGAIETPRLLLASGVGDPGDLRRLGVPTVVSAPAVGARLLDHPGTAIFLRPRSGYWRPRPPLIQTVCRFDSGRVAGPNDLLMQPGSTVPLGARDVPLVSLMMQVGKPRGWGRIRWESVEAGGAVTIESRLFEHPEDRAMAAVALERMRELLSHPSVRRAVTPVVPWRGLLDRPRAMDRVIRHLCGSGYHPSGTAPMGGHPSDSVTDGRGRVWGVEGLRIADASLLPTIPTSNIHLPILMVAERMAEFLRDDVAIM
jgi:choline dehydrogenase